jgi:hypothetical protein
MVESLGLAIRYWFWHCGIRPKVAFKLFRKWFLLKKVGY